MLEEWEHKEGQEGNSLQLTNESFSLIHDPQPVAPGEEGVGVSLLNPRQLLQAEAQPLLFRGVCQSLLDPIPLPKGSSLPPWW